MRYRYRGETRGGISVGGMTTVPPSVFVERKYRAGWRWLTVEALNGTVVGMVRSFDSARTWWAEGGA